MKRIWIFLFLLCKPLAMTAETSQDDFDLTIYVPMVADITVGFAPGFSSGMPNPLRQRENLTTHPLFTAEEALIVRHVQGVTYISAKNLGKKDLFIDLGITLPYVTSKQTCTFQLKDKKHAEGYYLTPSDNATPPLKVRFFLGKANLKHPFESLKEISPKEFLTLKETQGKVLYALVPKSPAAFALGRSKYQLNLEFDYVAQ